MDVSYTPFGPVVSTLFSFWRRERLPARASAMSNTAGIRIGFMNSRKKTRRRWLGWLHRTGIMPTVLLRWVLALGAAALISCIDLMAAIEVRFSIFYIVPIAYATWFIQIRSGVLLAVLCEVIWLTAEVVYQGELANPGILMQNSGLRLAFFVAGIVAVALTKRSAARLLQVVVGRTRSEAARRRKLEREMADVSAREQLRLAADLHDGLGQYLSALALHARMLADDLRQANSAQAAQAERIVTLVRKTNQVTRQVSQTLWHPEARTGALVADLRTLATEFEQLTGVRCEFESAQEALPLDEYRATMLFRIVQEALNNSVKHARPHVIRVSVARADRTLKVRIINDGHAATKIESSEAGSGAIAMKFRAQLIGAQLETCPFDTGNYKVECVLPMSA